MNSSKLLVGAVAAISIAGAATYAYAQTATPDAVQPQRTMPQTQTPGQMPEQPAYPSSTSRTAPDGSMLDAQSTSPTNRANADADRMNQAGKPGATGMANAPAPMTTERIGTRSPSDGTSTKTERVARADRN